MIKIDNISIKHFKNIESANLDLSSLNIIVGPNNSGKTSFLQILPFVNMIINGSTEQIDHFFDSGVARDLGDVVDTYRKEKGRMEFQLSFSDSTKKTAWIYFLSISWILGKDTDLIEEEYLNYKNIHSPGKPINLFKRNKSKVEFGDDFKKTSILETIKPRVSVVRLLKNILDTKEKSNPNEAISALESILTTPIFYFSSVALNDLDTRKSGSRTIGLNLNREIYKLINSTNWNIFLQAIDSFLNIQKFKIDKYVEKVSKKESKNREEIYFSNFLHFNRHKSISDLSDGSQLLIALIVKILLSEHNIFLIEEPENSLHPKAINNLMGFIKSFENEKQFIITTHSIVLINTIQPENVITAVINEDGSSQLSKVKNIKELKKRLKKGYVSFSDEIFFESDSKADIETES